MTIEASTSECDVYSMFAVIPGMLSSDQHPLPWELVIPPGDSGTAEIELRLVAAWSRMPPTVVGAYRIESGEPDPGFAFRVASKVNRTVGNLIERQDGHCVVGVRIMEQGDVLVAVTPDPGRHFRVFVQPDLLPVTFWVEGRAKLVAPRTIGDVAEYWPIVGPQGLLPCGGHREADEEIEMEYRIFQPARMMEEVIAHLRRDDVWERYRSELSPGWRLRGYRTSDDTLRVSFSPVE